MLDLEQLLRKTVSENASDLHLTVGSPPCYRLNGNLVRLPYPEISADELRTSLRAQISGDYLEQFEEKHDLDFSMELAGLARFRCNYFTGRRGDAAVFRVIPTRIKTVEELGLPAVVHELARKERGLVLVTGPTGSGKSTTLAAIIHLINITRQKHILTIEDPIEFIHEHRSCLVNQREVHSHTESFTTALRAALREDPDVILVGEMRDLETISLAVTAAETGHLVFGTLHTSSAPQTVDRIIDVFPPHQQSQIRTMLSESLEGVLAQTLIEKRGGGRIAAIEVLLGTSAVRNLIREGKTFQLRSIMETNTNIGMQTMEQVLVDMFHEKLITAESALDRGVDEKALFPEGVPVPKASVVSAVTPEEARAFNEVDDRLQSITLQELDDPLDELAPLTV
jgi:twitching motility protein PilT